MSLKRYTNEELVEKCKDVFYNYMSRSKTFYYRGDDLDCTKDCPTPIDVLHLTTLKSIDLDLERIEIYQEAIEKHKNSKDVEDRQNIEVIQEQIDYLKKVMDIKKKSNLKFQKERRELGYKENHSGLLPYSCSSVRIPLNKHINSFYDDFVLEVLFFDDATTLNGKYDEYKKLSTSNEREDFIRENTEITHMGLIIMGRDKNHLATVQLLGNLNYNDPRVKSGSIVLLDSKFSDFNSLILSDTMKMKNNDLRQFFQSKIDLDKEDMELMAEKNIRGDNYKILKSPENLWIRYMCPSTGRVYYNSLVLRNLKISDYYKEDNYESYINSWWNITHMGERIEGKPVIRC